VWEDLFVDQLLAGRVPGGEMRLRVVRKVG
jgi:hypothetical protein